jgi:hypothetical protein
MLRENGVRIILENGVRIILWILAGGAGMLRAKFGEKRTATGPA